MVVDTACPSLFHRVISVRSACLCPKLDSKIICVAPKQRCKGKAAQSGKRWMKAPALGHDSQRGMAQGQSGRSND